MHTYVAGLAFGMILQLSVGPVCLCVLNRSVSVNKWEGYKMACGVAIADAVYIALAFTGASGLLTIIWLRRVLLFAGAFVIIRFGFQTLFARTPLTVTEFRTGSFTEGLKLTMANPLTIVFWTGTFGTLLAAGKLTGMAVIPFVLGCISATFLFLLSVATAGSYLQPFLGPKIYRFFNCSVGVALIIFGVRMIFL